MRNIVHIVFPFIEMRKANKNINEKIINLLEKVDKDEDLECINKFKDVPSFEVEKYFNTILSNRKSLEEKAKVNVLVVTLAVTVILGLISFLLSAQNQLPDDKYLNCVLLLLFGGVFFYLVFGSLYSLESLNGGESKEIYNLSPSDYMYLASIGNKKEKDKELVYIYTINAELNTMINLKINNLISCTYSNIYNALILLGIIGVVFCALFTFNDHNKNEVVRLSEQSNEHVLEDINSNLTNLQLIKKLDEIKKQQEKIVNEIREMKN